MIELNERATPGLGRYERRYGFELDQAPARLGERIGAFFAARGASGLVVEPAQVRFSRGSLWGSCLPGPRHPHHVEVEIEDLDRLRTRITCRYRGRSLLPTERSLRREVQRLRTSLVPGREEDSS